MLVWRIVFGLIVICLVAGEIGDFSDEDYGESTIEKRSVLAAASAISDIPGKVVNAVKRETDLHNETRKANWATISLNFTNYCNWILRDFYLKSFDGKIDGDGTKINDINPGQQFSLHGYQTKSLGKTEAIAYFNVKDWPCLVYWRISDHHENQSETDRFNFGCYPREYFQALRSIIERNLREKVEKGNLSIKHKRYEKEANTIPYCGSKNFDIPFCIDATAKNSAHLMVRIAVYPKKLSDVVPSLRSSITQKSLDERVIKALGANAVKTSEGNRLSQPFACLFGFVALLAALFAI